RRTCGDLRAQVPCQGDASSWRRTMGGETIRLRGQRCVLRRLSPAQQRVPRKLSSRHPAAESAASACLTAPTDAAPCLGRLSRAGTCPLLAANLEGESSRPSSFLCVPRCRLERLPLAPPARGGSPSGSSEGGSSWFVRFMIAARRTAKTRKAPGHHARG